MNFWIPNPESEAEIVHFWYQFRATLKQKVENHTSTLSDYDEVFQVVQPLLPIEYRHIIDSFFYYFSQTLKSLPSDFHDGNQLKRVTERFLQCHSFYIWGKYSEFVLNALIRCSDHYPHFVDLAQWFPLEQIPEDLFIDREYQGQVYLSIGERYCNKLGRHLAQCLLEEHQNTKLSYIAHCIEKIYDEKPHLEWLPYYLMKYYSKDGTYILDDPKYFPIIEKNSKQFWMWQWMAEHSGGLDPLSFYSQALLQRHGVEKYKIRLMELTIELYVARRRFTEAKYFIQKSIAIRQREQYNRNARIELYTEADWFAKEKLVENADWLNQDAQTAVQFFKKLQENFYDKYGISTVLCSIANEKGIVISDADGLEYFFPKHLCKPHWILGTGFKVFLQTEPNGKTKIVGLMESEESARMLICPFKGIIQIHPGSGFGFVSDKIQQVFIPPYLAKEFENKSKVEGDCVPKTDRKKGTKGWVAIRCKSAH